jgi:hypothetical protein
MLTFGEGWHNNHHAKPQSPCHGLAWYEFDLNWYGICAMRMVRLAWDLKIPNTPVNTCKESMPIPLSGGWIAFFGRRFCCGLRHRLSPGAWHYRKSSTLKALDSA